jgi:hypothetical protein
MPDQLDLFTPVPSLPQGFKHQPEFLSQRLLVTRFLAHASLFGKPMPPLTVSASVQGWN